ncbi:hypothetical protein QQF64_019681 [Cirrhinus molitorella]|uniref:Uncharacterized protein n=1 Tax=Cirrhinus molitorella TaxID=172907 RepID=A0ABR3LG87_9TELE
MKRGLLLFVFGWFKLPWLVECFVVHVSEDAGPGTVIADLERSAACALDQLILPRFAESFLRPDAGVLTLSDALNCDSVLSNPFSVYAIVDCADNASRFRHLVTSQYDVHVHGKKCARERKREEKLDVEIISLTDTSECRGADTALFRVFDVLPGNPTRCNVTGTSTLYLKWAAVYFCSAVFHSRLAAGVSTAVRGTRKRRLCACALARWPRRVHTNTPEEVTAAGRAFKLRPAEQEEEERQQ